jgi:hypothetical protein
MKYRDDKKLVALFAKTALLENELADPSWMKILEDAGYAHIGGVSQK